MTHGVLCSAAFAFVITLFMPEAISTAAEEPELFAVLARVQLLPVEGDPDSSPFKSREDTLSANASPEEQAEAAKNVLRNEARMARFEKWVRYEDEFLSFMIPDDPRVHLQIQTPNDTIPVDGQFVRSNAIRFFRCYRLTFKGETYCLLLLDRQGDFDNSICFCGHVPYEKYLQHHGALYRFSLLENGKIKKIQTLGEGLRLALFEWTHMPIHQEVYTRIALSVQWHDPPHDLQSLTSKIQQEYGKTGFLEKGMDRDAVVALLGPPTSEDVDGLHYVFRRSHDDPPGSEIEEISRTISLKDGKFQEISPDWEKSRWLPPEPNSIPWILAKLKNTQQGEVKEDAEDEKEEDEKKNDSIPLARDDELKPLLDRVVELLPNVRGIHWMDLCHASVLLAQRGVKNPRVFDIMQKRYLDPQLGMAYASEVLQIYDSKKSQELFVKRIQLEMSLAKTPEAIQKQGDNAYGWGVKDLLGYLEQTHSQHDALILEAMDHPHAGVRSDGFAHWADIPVSMARPRLRKGVSDPFPEVRAACVESLVRMALDTPSADATEDLKLLRVQLAKEQDPDVVKNLEKAIEQLEQK
jgi:hypothetical protein